MDGAASMEAFHSEGDLHQEEMMDLKMAEKMQEMIVLNQELNNEWWRKTPSTANLKKCGALLAKLKIELTKFKFLPITSAEATQKELLIARNMLEVGVTWSIAMKDIPSFERYMAQLKPYYLDYKDSMEDSMKMYEILGLNLMCLLSQSRVAEFHTELELLPIDEVQSQVYISHPVSLEQYFVEGNYNKIFQAKGNVPALSFNFFMDLLLETVRVEICSCIEKAYKQISLSDVAVMLKTEPTEIKKYGIKRGWNLGADGRYHFTDGEKPVDNTSSEEMVARTVEYAKELEKIV